MILNGACLEVGERSFVRIQGEVQSRSWFALSFITRETSFYKLNTFLSEGAEATSSKSLERPSPVAIELVALRSLAHLANGVLMGY